MEKLMKIMPIILLGIEQFMQALVIIHQREYLESIEEDNV